MYGVCEFLFGSIKKNNYNHEPTFLIQTIQLYRVPNCIESLGHQYR